MNPEQWKRVRTAFEEALSLETGARSEFMAQLRSTNGELAQAVADLLDRDGESGVDEAPPRDDWNGLFGSATLAGGTRLGAYKITGEIASGGMGTVYRADRADAQFEKSVAIKLIKRGMDSEEILKRFRYERQVLADLEHPGIARLLDGGVSEDGQPYFVMEFVEGQAIDEYCESHKLTLRARLQLFQEVCQAVHYAHQRLVVHRDLKPNNILVSSDGAAKLLDFGVARMLDAENEEERQQWTADKGFFGTPSFASPEQLRGERITTSTDVYSLGAVLYRLLTGSRPHVFSEVSRDEARRLVCEVEPIRPSLQPAESGGIPRNRLKGDLDNIVLMALRKESDRRYASAEQLAEDLQRHLDGLPVIARPNTLSYRAQKFLRRNRASASIGVALAASIIAGLITSSSLYVEAAAANDVAVERFQDVRRMAATFIFEVSSDIGPLEGTVSAREKIVRSALTYLDHLATTSEDDASVMVDLSRAYLQLGDLQGGAVSANLGQRDAARASYTKAAAMAEALLNSAPNSIEYKSLLATCLVRHADLDSMLGSSERARVRMEEALDLCPPNSTNESVLETRALILSRQGDQLVRDGQATEATTLLSEAVGIQEKLLASHAGEFKFRRSLAAAYTKLSEANLYVGETERAEELCLLACAQFEDLLETELEDADTRQLFVAAHFSLGTLYLRSNRFEQSIAPFELADFHGRQIVEADPSNELARHNRTAGLQMLATALNRLGRYEEALERLQVAHRSTQELLQLDPTNLRTRRALAISASSLAAVLTQLRQLPEAQAFNDEARAAFEALQAAEPERAEPKRDLVACLTNIGGFHMGGGRDADHTLPDRRDHAARARQSFQTALDELRELEGEGRLAKIDEPLVEMLARFVQDADDLEALLAEESPNQVE